MAKLLKLRRGTTTQHASFTGAEGEVTVDITKDTAVVHDGSQAGGTPLAKEDMANVSSASIAGRLGTDYIATTKIAAGALPTDVTVASANIVNGTIVEGDLADSSVGNSKIVAGSVTSSKIADGTIVNADVNASAAIAGTKISPNFGSQAIQTTGTAATGALTVTGNISVSGQVDGVDIMTLNNSKNSLSTVNGSLLNGVTATTQAQSDNSTKVSTTAYVRTAVADVVNSAPAALDTLNELAAALGDDANYATTTATSIGTKLPKSGGQMTGNITMAGSQTVDGRDLSVDGSKLDGIDAGAKDDQTSTEIKALLQSDNLTGAHLAANSINSSELSDNAVDTAAIANNAVTTAKIEDFASGRIMGRLASGTGDCTQLTATSVRSIINVEDGATADQSASEIASALNGQNVYTTGAIGRDSNDNIAFSDNSYMNIYISGSNEFRFESDGDFHADGDVIAYSTTTASDENLKKNIVTVPDGLAKVEALKGVTFEWNKNDQKSAGVIAQDVEKVLPEIVKTVQDFDGNDYKTVNYSGLTSILIEAVKELSARVKVLETK